jgi:16S rRNA (adenine1518-N6/adenine1519-N6)-dimethyltransferase
MDTELLFDVPPSCFIPQPKVTSSVIRLTRRAERPAKVRDEGLMFRVIRAAFNQRRKTLVNAISSQLGEFTKEQAENALKNCGFDPRIRGEMLDIGGFAKISDELNSIDMSDL